MNTSYEHITELQLDKIKKVFCNIVNINKQCGYTSVELTTSWKLKELRNILNEHNIKYECIIYNKEVTTIEL